MWINGRDSTGAQYAIASRSEIDRLVYRLWKKNDEAWVSIATDKSPAQLESKYIFGR